MEVGKGPNWGCSAKEKKNLGYETVMFNYIYSFILSHILVTSRRVWIGESIYWIFTSRNYN
jgi:hypothetical protein